MVLCSPLKCTDTDSIGARTAFETRSSEGGLAPTILSLHERLSTNHMDLFRSDGNIECPPAIPLEILNETKFLIPLGGTKKSKGSQPRPPWEEDLKSVGPRGIRMS